MIYRFDAFELDDEIFVLRREGVEVHLRAQALDVLIYLVRHHERLVTKRELIDAVWQGASISESALPQAIVAIRRALGAGEESELVQTTRGRGYRFFGSVRISKASVAGASPATPTTALVGHDPALRRLGDLLANAAAGRGGVGLLTGPPGIGKTRLMAELAERARAARARVVEARCPAERGAPDLWLWIELLRLYGGGPKVPRAHEAAALAKELGDKRVSAARPATGHRFEAFDQVVDLFRRAAQHEPLVLVVDDLQFADSASLLLLKFFASSCRAAPLLLMGAYSDVALSTNPVLARTIGALTREDPARCIVLEPLSTPSVAELAASLLGHMPDDALLGRIVDKTGGNPLLITQMLHGVARAGARGAGASTSALLSTREMREAIGLQIGELSPATGEMLLASSVLGTELGLARLARVLGVSTAALLPRVDEALRGRVLATTEQDRYRFVHTLVRDVLYRSLSLLDRARLHEAAGAAALQEHSADQAVGHFERALRYLDMLPAAAGAPDDNMVERARALLDVLQKRARPLSPPG